MQETVEPIKVPPTHLVIYMNIIRLLNKHLGCENANIYISSKKTPDKKGYCMY